MAVVGKSAIERLPLELIHKIHFERPGNALLATSKTMAAYFEARVLPVRMTAESVARQWLSDSTKDRYRRHPRVNHREASAHTAFILERVYTHTPQIIHRIMSILLRKYSSTIYSDLLRKPPMDPSYHLANVAHPNKTIATPMLPRPLIHYMYHNLPTCPSAMSYAIHQQLSRAGWAVAEIIMECGGDPRFGDHRGDKTVRSVIDGWDPNSQYATICDCGWTFPKPGPWDRTPLCVEICRLRYSTSKRLHVQSKKTRQTAVDKRYELSSATLKDFRLKIWLFSPVYHPHLGRNLCVRAETYKHSELFLERLSSPKLSATRKLFLQQCYSEYRERLLHLSALP